MFILIIPQKNRNQLKWNHLTSIMKSGDTQGHRFSIYEIGFQTIQNKDVGLFH